MSTGIQNTFTSLASVLDYNYNSGMNEYQSNDGNLEEIELPEQPLTPAEVEYEQTIERLDTFFSGLTPGVTLLIERLRPSWCSGVLEEFTIGDEAIGLDYFIETWGGELLIVKVRGKKGQLRGSYKIPLHSFPPLRYGEPIRQSNRGDRFRDDSPNPTPTANPVMMPAPQGFSGEKIIAAVSGLAPVFMQWIKSQDDRRRHEEERRQADMAMMMNAMKSNQGGGLSDITKVGAVMAQLNEMFRQNSPAAPSDSEIEFLPHALEVLRTVMGPQSQQKEQQPRAKLTAPSSGPPSSRPTANVTPLRSPNDISSILAQMEPAKAVESVMDALGKMSPDKRDATMGTFLMKYQQDMSDDLVEDNAEDDEGQRGYR